MQRYGMKRVRQLLLVVPTALISVSLLCVALVACSSTAIIADSVEKGGAFNSSHLWNSATTGGASSAISWAETFFVGQQNEWYARDYKGNSLLFVANAYGARSVNDTAMSLAGKLTLSDPTETSAAPKGALMFFNTTSLRDANGLVGLSLGESEMIVTQTQSGSVSVSYRENIPVDSSDFGHYLGWAMPPATWGPLARQAAGATFVQLATAFDGYHLDITMVAFRPDALLSVTCADEQHTLGYMTFQVTASDTGWQEDNATCSFQSSMIDYWAVVDGVQSNSIFWIDPSGPQPTLETTGEDAQTWTNYAQGGGDSGPDIPAYHTVGVVCRISGLELPDGNVWWYRIADHPWDGAYYVTADAFFNNGQTSGNLKKTPLFDPAVPICGSASASTYAETTGGSTHTWTDYAHAGGNAGAVIPVFQSVQVSCRLSGFKVADGNAWWYRISSSPWDNTYYASADAFYNNGQTSGSLHATPWVDTNVPVCTQSRSNPPINPPTPTAQQVPPTPTNTPASHQTPPTPTNTVPAPPTPTNTVPAPPTPTFTSTPTPPSYVNETTGGVVHTWTNYMNAGGYEGPNIGAYQTVQIACKLQGFHVADGNPWWYRIASNPWSNGYYASADAFYNNGQTSGSLIGTPWVDNNVPNC